MKNIIELTEREREELIKRFKNIPEIGSGAEGSCYLIKSNKTKKVLKLYDYDNDYNVIDNYKIDDIIMDSDYHLKSFAFPETIFVSNGKLVGYISRFIKRDYLDVCKINSLEKINMKKLLLAIKRYIKDVEVISKDGIYTYELCFNLMFDGEYLIGIDTPSYKKEEGNTLKKNLKTLKYSLSNVFSIMAENSNKKSDEYENAVINEINKIVLK